MDTRADAAAAPSADPPGTGWYLLAAVIALATTLGIFGLIGWLIFSGAGNEQFLAPGRHSMELGKPGAYLVWNDYRTMFDGRVYEQPERLPGGMRITVVEASSGVEVAVRPESGTRVTVGQTSRASAARFSIERPGRYDIDVSGDFQPRVLSVSDNALSEMLWIVASIAFLALAGFGSSLAIFGWTYFRRDQAADTLSDAAGLGLSPGAALSAEEASLKRLAAIVYGLQVASIFFGITLFAGIIINYLKLREVRGTWLESHFRWQMRTFWLTLLWTCVGILLLLLLVGFAVLLATAGWMLYRALKGWLELADGRPMRA